MKRQTLPTARSFLCCACLVLLENSATLAQPQAGETLCELRLELVDAASGKATSGLVQIRRTDGSQVPLPQLLNRGLGLSSELAIHDWYVLVQPTVIHVPSTRIEIRAFSGLETEMAQLSLDLNDRASAECRIELQSFQDSRALGWQSANTHVHLKNTSRPETDRYLIECSQADGLDVVFVSYLERPSEDVHYSTNAYSRSELRSMSNAHTHFDHGEEHRHNLSPWEEGYGHVMLLNIPELIRPVSIGPGITDSGTDGTPLRTGIDQARSAGGRIIWCHNAWGLENIPSWLAGRLDANNIFDGGTHGSYEHSFYRYLNIGLNVPFSTGTDWFIYDFSRVYVQHPSRLSPEDWLTQLAAGNSYITNGPLLEFSVAGKSMGDSVLLNRPGSLRIEGNARGREDFQRIELIQNGRVLAKAEASPQKGHFVAHLDFELPVDEPCWLALRTPPPSAPDKGLVRQTPLNAYGQELFSHTSAIFVDMAGKRYFDPATAQALLGELKENLALIQDKARFSGEDERRQVLAIYEEAIARLNTITENRSHD